MAGISAVVSAPFMQRMLEAFVALPFERLDPAEIQNRLVRIGRVE